MGRIDLKRKPLVVALFYVVLVIFTFVWADDASAHPSHPHGDLTAAAKQDIGKNTKPDDPCCHHGGTCTPAPGLGIQTLAGWWYHGGVALPALDRPAPASLAASTDPPPPRA